MSHTRPINRDEAWELEVLKKMCEMTPSFHFMEGQKTYKAYYGPQPCEHAIRVDGCSYEIGITGQSGNLEVQCDLYHAGGLNKALGNSNGLLNQYYDAAKFTMVSESEGYMVYAEQHNNPEREGWMKMVANGGSW